MNIAELTTTVIVVAVLVTVTLSAAVFLSRRLKRLRGSDPSGAQQEQPEGSWYFVRYSPEASTERDGAR
jgi:hypothetical protein